MTAETKGSGGNCGAAGTCNAVQRDLTAKASGAVVRVVADPAEVLRTCVAFADRCLPGGDLFLATFGASAGWLKDFRDRWNAGVTNPGPWPVLRVVAASPFRLAGYLAFGLLCAWLVTEQGRGVVLLVAGWWGFMLIPRLAEKSLPKLWDWISK